MSSPSGPPRVVSGKHQAPRAARSATPAGACAGTSAASGQEREAAVAGVRGDGRRRQVAAQVQQPGERARLRLVRVAGHGEPQVTAGTGQQHRAPRREPGHGDLPGHGQDPVGVQRAGQQRAGFGQHPDPGPPGPFQLGQPGPFQRRGHLVRQLLQPPDLAVARTVRARAAATASTPVTWPSTMNGTVETDGAVRSHAAGPSPLAARTPRSPSSSATRA